MLYEMDKLPRRVDYRRAAELISEYFFPISHRTLERWDLKKIKVNGKNTVGTEEVFAEAAARLEAAKADSG